MAVVSPAEIMNIHHLELFFYVARFGGIAEAVRNMPYGIQQPAVSAQVIQLEECLGLTLFHRRPFALTPAGEKLYRFIEPLKANIKFPVFLFQFGAKLPYVAARIFVKNPGGCVAAKHGHA